MTAKRGSAAAADADKAPPGRFKVSGFEVRDRSWTGYDLIQWVDAAKTVWTAEPSGALLAEDFTQVLPVRAGPQYQNRVNANGFYFWPRTDSHVWFESRLEEEVLVDLDQQADIVAIASQPMRILFRKGADARSQTPDFIGNSRSGDIVVVNVKPLARLTVEHQKQFAEVDRICAMVGWTHAVINEAHPMRTLNLRVLRKDRHARCHPRDAAMFEQIQNIFDSGRSIHEGRMMLNRRHPPTATPFILHMLWHGLLVTDLTQRLSLETVLKTSSREGSCCHA